MFESLAGMVMATKIHFAQMEIPFIKKKDRIVAEEIYKNKVNKIEETEKYEKSRMPESGYMTVEEYESKSRAKTKKEVSAEDKAKSEELKTSAIANAQKYLEVNPQAEDKEDVEELIKDLTEPEKEEQPKVLKG